MLPGEQIPTALSPSLAWKTIPTFPQTSSISLLPPSADDLTFYFIETIEAIGEFLHASITMSTPIPASAASLLGLQMNHEAGLQAWPSTCALMG